MKTLEDYLLGIGNRDAWLNIMASTLIPHQ